MPWPGLIHYHKALVETHPGLKDHTECFIFFNPKCLLIFLKSNGVEMLNFNSLYDILSENHNISWTKWYKDLVKLKEKDTVQNNRIELISELFLFDNIQKV